MIIVGTSYKPDKACETGDIIYVAIFDSLKICGESVPTVRTVGYKYLVIFDDLNQKPASLRSGQKRLMNLQKENWGKVKFGDVVNDIKAECNPVAENIERFIAGEHLITDDLKIRSWGNVREEFLGPAFHRKFVKGQILYGSRRTYLRKVALADFDGVCANTTFVIRAKEEILLQGLLKHIMLSEAFTQYSIGVSKGSTNPYINWKDLDNFIFQIPDIETQREIVSILDEIIEIAEQTREQKQTLKNLKFKLLNEILG